jgi:hypothetical protein
MASYIFAPAQSDNVLPDGLHRWGWVDICQRSLPDFQRLPGVVGLAMTLAIFVMVFRDQNADVFPRPIYICYLRIGHSHICPSLAFIFRRVLFKTDFLRRDPCA